MTRRLIATAAVLAAGLATAHAQTREPAPPARYGIGRPATPAEIAAIDIDVRPDGRGLPAGRGTAAEGAPIYAAKCAACHGATGKEGPNDVLVGRATPGFTFSQDPALPHTIGNYWPYATTVFDVTRRSMPMFAPGSLTADEVYAITAYLLATNGVIGERDEMNAQSLPKVRMPNRDGFVGIDAALPRGPR